MGAVTLKPKSGVKVVRYEVAERDPFGTGFTEIVPIQLTVEDERKILHYTKAAIEAKKRGVRV